MNALLAKVFLARLQDLFLESGNMHSIQYYSAKSSTNILDNDCKQFTAIYFPCKL